MGINSIYIDYAFTHLNEYISKERANKYIASKIKKEETYIAYLAFRGKKFNTPCKIRFIWHVKNKRRDLDNIAFSKKFILDSMVKAKAIPNDNLTHIIAFEDTYVLDTKEGVEIIVEEMNQ